MFRVFRVLLGFRVEISGALFACCPAVAFLRPGGGPMT